MKISVITVCYNSEDTIERTIKSVISQKYNDLEYIVIDGGSTDKTVQIIRKYEQHISYWVSEPDNGIYDAMNKGIVASTGEVIDFLNSDDWYAEDTLSRVENYFKETEADIISGNVFRVNAGKITVLPRIIPEDDDAYFFHMMFPHQALFAKTTLFDKCGMFNTDYIIKADYDWILRVHLAGCKIKMVEDCFAYFSYGGISTTRRIVSAKEQWQSATFHMKKYQKFYLEERIQTHYKARVEWAERTEICEYVIKNKQHSIRTLFKPEGKYYIWGAGKRGKQCKELFEEIDVSIMGFIDSDIKISEFEGYEVIRPENIQEDSCVCITPKKCEEDIICQLRKIGFQEENFFTFTALVNEIVDLGR